MTISNVHVKASKPVRVQAFFRLLLLAACVCVMLPAASGAEPHAMKKAYFGETHVHTAYSLDAYIGGTRLTPDGAYRFAKGEEVVVNGHKH